MTLRSAIPSLGTNIRDDLLGDRVTCRRSIVHGLGIERLAAGQQRGLTGADGGTRHANNGGGRDKRFETAACATVAGRAIGVDDEVADLAGQVVAPMQQLAAEENPSRNPGADAYIDQVLAVGGIVKLVDTQGGGAHVVLKRSGYAKALAQARADGVAIPKEVHGHERNTVDRIHLAGHAQADACQSMRNLRFAQCQVDAVGDALQRSVGAAGIRGDGGLVDGPQLLVHELSHELSRDSGAADVDAGEV